MRTAINRLCSVVLHAVGTGQLDLLYKCEASADQLQAHFRIPPWQSASSVRPLSMRVRGLGLTDRLLRVQWASSIDATTCAQQSHGTAEKWSARGCGVN